jgi:hypothetical protein
MENGKCTKKLPRLMSTNSISINMMEPVSVDIFFNFPFTKPFFFPSQPSKRRKKGEKYSSPSLLFPFQPHASEEIIFQGIFLLYGFSQHAIDDKVFEDFRFLFASVAFYSITMKQLELFNVSSLMLLFRKIKKFYKFLLISWL